jgi:hypothetical protein
MNNGDSGFFNAYVGVTSSKTAAVTSESIGTVLPHNLLGAPGAAILAGMKRTRTNKEQISADKDRWKNILIPGRAMYNKLKRTGVAEREWDKMTDEQRRAVIADVGSVEGGKEEAYDIDMLTSNMSPEDAKKYQKARGVLRDLKQDWEHLTKEERVILRDLLLTQAGHLQGKGKPRTPQIEKATGKEWKKIDSRIQALKEKFHLQELGSEIDFVDEFGESPDVGSDGYELPYWPERVRAHKYPKYDGKAQRALRREILEQHELERINEMKAEQHVPNLWPGGHISSPEEDRSGSFEGVREDVLGKEREKERRQRRKAVVTGKEASSGEGLSAIWDKLTDNPEIHQTLLGLMRSTGTPNINPNS